MKEGTVSSQNDPIYLKTCPEYWVKDTMKANDKFVDICKNYNKTDVDTTKFVGGSTKDNGSFFTNFKKESDGDASSNVESLLSTMNNNSINPIGDEGDQIDSFIEGPIYFDERTGSNNGVTTIPEGTNELNNKVTYFNTPSNVDYVASNLKDIPGHHYHYISSMIHHDNGADGHDNIVGATHHNHTQCIVRFYEKAMQTTKDSEKSERPW
jgi:hypothetical protein